MNVPAISPAEITIASFGHPNRRAAWNDAPIEPEVVRSGTDRRKRQDRRTEDLIRRRLTLGLEELMWDGTPVPPPARIVAAARLFTEGNRFFTGQLVDRSA
jgi:hypothetical protein